MIVDTVIALFSGLIDGITGMLPVAGVHTWIDNASATALPVITGAFAWDDVLPLHEVLLAIGVLLAIAIPSLAWKIAVAIYRLVPFKSS